VGNLERRLARLLFNQFTLYSPPPDPFMEVYIYIRLINDTREEFFKSYNVMNYT